MKGVAKVLHPQRGYGFKPRVAGLPSEAAKREGGSRAEATLGTPDPGYPNPNGVASVPESIPDVFLIPALVMKPQKLPVFVLKCTFAVMFLLIVNILGHYRKLGFGNGEATVTGLP